MSLKWHPVRLSKYPAVDPDVAALKFLHLDCLVFQPDLITCILFPCQDRKKLKWVHMAQNNWLQSTHTPHLPPPAWSCRASCILICSRISFLFTEEQNYSAQSGLIYEFVYELQPNFTSWEAEPKSVPSKLGQTLTCLEQQQVPNRIIDPSLGRSHRVLKDKKTRQVCSANVGQLTTLNNFIIITVIVTAPWSGFHKP